MKILIISDIHANLFAFEAVLKDSQGQWDIIWFLGDLIGYGPHPNECVQLLREYNHLSLTGNHDRAVLNRIDINSFNSDAQSAIRWTREQLAEDNRVYLDSLPAKTIQSKYTLSHASPRHPIWEYILDTQTASINFDHFETPYCLVGHSHVPVIFVQDEEGQVSAYGPNYEAAVLLGEERLIINPGSVGQPRDNDPRAAYALLDTQDRTWQHRRVSYPIEKTQQAMREENMSTHLIVRLEFGW